MPFLHNFLRQNLKTLISTVKKSMIDMDSIAFLMVYSDEPDNYNAKGFIVVNDNSGFEAPIVPCEKKINQRFIAEHIRDNVYLIKYKWRFSKEYIVDSFYVFSSGSTYMAYSTKYNNDDYTMLKTTVFSWSFGPTSNDDREVVFICPREKQIVLYSTYYEK